MHNGADIAIVIVNYNNSADAIHCIQSLRQVPEQVKIFLVDNHSTDNSLIYFKEHLSPDVEILANNRNSGWSGGNNAGIQAALQGNYAYIWLLNDDTEVVPDVLSKLLVAAKQDPGIGIVGARNMLFDQRDKPWQFGGLFDPTTFTVTQIETQALDSTRVYDVSYVPGSCMLIKREVFDKIGFIDERFFFYGAALDFSYRASRQGFRSVYVPDAIIYHKVNATFGAFSSPKNQYYWLRARFLLIKKHSRLSLAIIEISKDIFSNLIKAFHSRDRRILKRLLCNCIGLFDGLTGRYGFKQYWFF